MDNPRIEICGINGVSEEFPVRALAAKYSGISPGRRRSMAMTDHPSDHDLERHHLGMMTDESELAAFDEQLLGRGSCAERAYLATDYVHAIRAGIIKSDFELEG
jgi:hypothetical protein